MGERGANRWRQRAAAPVPADSGGRAGHRVDLCGQGREAGHRKVAPGDDNLSSLFDDSKQSGELMLNGADAGAFHV